MRGGGGWLGVGGCRRDNDALEERQAISACSLKLVLWLFSVRVLSRDARRRHRRSPEPVTFRLPEALTRQDTAASVYTRKNRNSFFSGVLVRSMSTTCQSINNPDPDATAPESSSWD